MSIGKIKWQSIVSKYAYPETWRSLWQVFNSVIPFFVLWYLAYRSLEVGYWLTLLLTIPAAGFMVRMFIIFHDCTHGSFLKTPLANNRLGLLLGVAVWTPYYAWKHSHAIHHATAGDLDRRGTGDVYTMTVEEYLAAPWYKKFGYRVMRNPLILFTIGASIVFVFAHRFWDKSAGKREKNSVVQFITSAGRHICWLKFPFCSWAAALGCGYSMCSTTLSRPIGNATPIGNSSKRVWMAVHSINFPKSCNGSPATSAFITYTISARRFPITNLKNVTTKTRSFRSSRSRLGIA